MGTISPNDIDLGATFKLLQMFEVYMYVACTKSWYHLIYLVGHLPHLATLVLSLSTHGVRLGTNPY